MIDWFTTVAQLINFLILVLLLRYFLYDRILAAMEKRQQEVAQCWDEAHQQRDEAAKEHEAAEQKVRQLDDQREQLMAKVGEEVEQYRQQLTSKVRGEVDEVRERWSDAIEEETQSFLHDLRRRASEEVCAVARRVLSDLADESLERQIVEQFLDRIDRLTDEQRQTVVAAIEGGNRAVVVQTTFSLAKDLKQAISKTLQSKFLAGIDVHFEQSDDILCGIALQTDAHKLAWDLRDYLIELEQAVHQTLEEESASRKMRHQQAAAVNG